MGNFRLLRLSEDIKRELSFIIKELKDYRISSMLNIVKVDLSNDLSYCKVYVSSIDGKEATKASVEGLKSASGYIKKSLGSRVEMRKMPDFKFIADDSIAYGQGINKILDELDDTK